jgi:hypothetical protein
MTRAWLALAALAACTAPEPVAQVPEWLRPADERPSEDLPEKTGDPHWRVLPALARCDAHLSADPVAVGRTLAWQPCAVGPPGCRMLAPAPDEPTRFTARTIADPDLRQNPGYHGGRVEVDSLVVGGGKVAVHHHPPTDRSRVVLVDVAAGEQRVWQPGPGPWPMRVVFVSPDEFAVEMRGEANGTTYLRLRHDTLPLLPPRTLRRGRRSRGDRRARIGGPEGFNRSRLHERRCPP